STLQAGLRQHVPQLADALERWSEAAKSHILDPLLRIEYPRLEKKSVDYALLERAKNVVVAHGSFGWDDLGSWNALPRHLKMDSAGNCVVGDFLHIDASHNIVFDARTKNRTPIAI